MRGHHIGEALVTHCMEKGKELGFGILQFNAVVKSNASALHLYEKLGFTRGTFRSPWQPLSRRNTAPP